MDTMITYFDVGMFLTFLAYTLCLFLLVILVVKVQLSEKDYKLAPQTSGSKKGEGD